MATEPIDVLILSALLSRLMPNLAVATSDITSPAIPTASPFVAYTPIAGTAYLEAHDTLRAEPDSPGVAFNQSTLLRGVFRVDVVVPNSQGALAGIRLAALVSARFPEGTRIALTSGQYLRLNKPATIAAAVKDAPWVRFPVSIPYLVIN